jgi:hypothetical protein
MIGRLEAGPQHAHHLGQERQAERRRDPEQAQLGAELGVLAGPLGLAVAAGDGRCGEAGLGDRRDDGGRVGEPRRVAHPRRLGGKVDAALGAGQPAHDLLDARRAGRAAHAGNAELEHLGRHVETGLADRRQHRVGIRRVGRSGEPRLPVAKLTWAATPGRRLRTFSRRTAQAAQLMPDTGRS